MKKSDAVKLAAGAAVLVMGWQWYQAKQAEAARRSVPNENYPLRLGDPSPLGYGFGDGNGGGWLPNEDQMREWMYGRF